ncbi:MAG: DinB family protein [Chloroflexota bacterium]
MIKAVFLDMDNTLLLNPDKVFAQRFLSLWDDFLSAEGISDASQRFRNAIRIMGHAQRGNSSNWAVTVREMGNDVTDTEALLRRFYAEVYPELASCIAPVDGAADLIYRLREEDYLVVIATNPIYPESAIQQRMAWAGLPTEDGIYEFISSADTMHFAKPDPCYYGELLARVGIEPDEALMVGDSMGNDIRPAQTVGLRTFHIGEAGLTNFMAQVSERLDDTQPIVLRPDMIQPQLRGNIGALYGLAESVEADMWHKRPDPDEWSILQIMCHLVTFEDENERARLATILQEENPFIIQPAEPGPDIEAYSDNGFAVAQEFLEKREETLALINQFTLEDWQRPARHSIFGLTTMVEMAYFTAQHDRLHLKQLCQTIGRCK